MSLQMFRLIAILTFMIFTVRCSDYVPDSNIPNVRVSLNLYLNDPEWSALRSVGNAVVYNDVCGSCALAGYNGLIIIRGGDGLIYAYDQCCTVNPGERHKVIVNGAIGVCEKDSSMFQLLDGIGTAARGPATLPLRTYHTNLIGNTLIITN